MSTLKVNTINAATSGQGVAVDVQNPRSFRNLHVNGGMLVHQRGGSITSDGYSLDMFARQQSSDGAFTITQSTTSPDGFSKSLKVDVTTADTSLAASQYAQIKSKIEAQDLQQLAYGTSSAKDITVSFYVRSNKTGNYGLWIQQSDSSFKQVTLQYTISSADTWERKSFTISGDTSGNINDDNGDGFIIAWGLAAGSNKTSGSLRSSWTAHASADEFAGQAVNILDSTSNEWYLTGVQVEVGSYATDFEHRSFADELARCERYFQKFTAEFRDDHSSDGSICYGTLALPCKMRAAPSISNSYASTYNVNTGASLEDSHIDSGAICFGHRSSGGGTRARRTISLSSEL